MPDLFAAAGILGEPPYAAMVPGAALLRGFALPYVTEILGSLEDISAGAVPPHDGTVARGDVGCDDQLR